LGLRKKVFQTRSKRGEISTRGKRRDFNKRGKGKWGEKILSETGGLCGVAGKVGENSWVGMLESSVREKGKGA